MPCDTITTQSVNLANGISDIVKDAFKHFKIRIAAADDTQIIGRLRGIDIQWRSGIGLDITAIGDGTDLIDEITKVYSEKAVEWAAKRANWKIQKIEDNVFQVIKSNNDALKITVLADGTLKIESDKISQANHMTAEAFLRYIAKACGGRQKRSHKKGFVGELKHTIDHILHQEHCH